MDELSSFIWFIVLVVGLLAFDLLIVHRKAHEISFREAGWWSVFWIGLSLLFNVYVYYDFGSQAGIDFFTGYLIEKSLSVDNLFVFLVIFKYFKTPKEYEYEVLFYGILGAIVFRGIFIALGITLLAEFHWIIYVLGLFLIFTGFKLAMQEDKKIEPEKNPVLKALRYMFPLTENYVGDRFFVRINNILHATPLFVVLISIETTDVVFALDSIPAILAITLDPFIVFSSNVFAILGLRSLYFCLAHMMNAFKYLHYGLALILIFIGVKMVLSGTIQIPTEIALVVVATILVTFSLISLLKRR